MTGVYMHALGDEADSLHPKVRDRYDIGPDDGVVCVGRGRMDITRGLLALPVLYAMTTQDLLFPEAGEDVPFTVRTVGYTTAAGHEAMTTRREFQFETTTRRFDSLTLWDADNDRLLDFLGADGRLASALHPRTEDGALVVEGGRQWARLGERYVPLPGPLAADVTVRDRYDETGECYHVDAAVENALAGSILTYSGTFTEDHADRGTTPAELRTARGITTLPPV